MTLHAFMAKVEEAAKVVKEIFKEEPIKIVGHIDADGISATAIVMKVLQRLGYQFSVSNIQQLSVRTLVDLKEEPYQHYIFVDLGSSLLDEIEKIIPERQVIILDHHIPKGNG
jgi:single-stranded DNA-specific DHH superfamily exonuclease